MLSTTTATTSAIKATIIKGNPKPLPYEAKWKVRRSIIRAIVFTLFFFLCKGLASLFVAVYLSQQHWQQYYYGGQSSPSSRRSRRYHHDIHGYQLLDCFYHNAAISFPSTFRGLTPSDTMRDNQNGNNKKYNIRPPPQSAKEHILQLFLSRESDAFESVGTDDDKSSTSLTFPINPNSDSHSIVPPRRRQEAYQNAVNGASTSAAGKDEGTTKPIFVLHVGLPKTGTTYLQCSICSDPNVTTPILRKDNFVYIGTCPYGDCLMDPDDYEDDATYLKHTISEFFDTNPKYVEEPGGHNGLGPVPHTLNMAVSPNIKKKLPKPNPEFLKHIEPYLGRRDINIMAVFEGLHSISARHIRSLAALLKPHYDVHVIIGYRPLYDWLPSKYNSIYKPSRLPYAQVWPGQIHPDFISSDDGGGLNNSSSGSTNNSSSSRREVRGGGIPPFDLYHRGSFTDYINEIEFAYEQHPAETVRNNYALHFDNVHVLPLHLLPHKKSTSKLSYTTETVSSQSSISIEQPDPLLEFMFCNVLRHLTQRTCAAVHRKIIGNLAFGVQNPTYPFNYDHLAVKAYQEGLLHLNLTNKQEMKRLQRERVAYLVGRYHEQTLNRTLHEFEHIICLPNTTLSRLEYLSWKMENSIFFPNSNTPFSSLSKDTSSMSLQKGQWNQLRVLHHQGFQRSVQQKKYCHVDAKRTLQDDVRWRFFFQSLNENVIQDSEDSLLSDSNESDELHGESDEEDEEVEI